MTRTLLKIVAVALLVPAGAAGAQTYGPAAPMQSASLPVALARPPGIGPELESAAERAVSGYPSIKAAKSNIRAAASDIKGAKWLRYPSISVEALAFAGGSDLANRSNVAANLVVDQPIYAGGRIKGTIRRAEALALVANGQLGEVEQDVTLRIINAYYGLARAARRAAILGEGLDEHRRLIDSIQRRVDQEVSPRADLDLARSRTAQLEQDLATTSAQRYASLQQLRELVGDPNYDPGPIPVYDPALHHPSPEQAIEQATLCSPRRERLQAEALVARADVKLAEAGILPQLSAQFSSNEVTGERVGVVLRAQTGGGLSNFSAATSARLRRDSADLDIITAERELRETVALDLVENVSTRERIASSENAAVSARSVTESYQRQYVAGRRTWLDMMNAVREATDAQLSAAEAEMSAMSSAARLLLRTCRWVPADLEPSR